MVKMRFVFLQVGCVDTRVVRRRSRRAHIDTCRQDSLLQHTDAQLLQRKRDV